MTMQLDIHHAHWVSNQFENKLESKRKSLDGFSLNESSRHITARISTAARPFETTGLRAGIGLSLYRCYLTGLGA